MNKEKINNKKLMIIISFCFLPLLLLFFFIYYPFIQTFINSFFSMSYTRNNGYVGFENYLELFQNGDYFSSLKVSFYYIGAAIIQNILALFLATLLYSNPKFSNFFKNSIFLPYLVNAIAISFIFRLFFTQGLVLDSILGFFGIPIDQLPYWLRDQSINNFSLSFVSIWRYTGFNMIILLGAMLSINKNQYDIATIDGMNIMQKFKFITFPNIKKVFYLTLMLSVVSSLNEFEIPYVIASGGANGTATFMIYIYKTAFIAQKIGLASAMVVLLMLMVMALSILLSLVFGLMGKNKNELNEIVKRDGLW